MKYFLVLLLSTIIILTGCQKINDNLSMNQQRSLLRATSDNAVTAILDFIDDSEKAEETADIIRDITKEVYDFINTGEVYNLTSGELRDRLTELVPYEYRIITDQLLFAASIQRLEVGENIGRRNVDRLKAVIIGINLATGQYKISDRRGN